MGQEAEGVALMEEKEDLMEEEVEEDMVDSMVEGVDMVMMVEEVDMEVEEDMGIEEDSAVEGAMVVEEDMDHQEEEGVDRQQEEDDTAQDQGRGLDHQFEDRHEEIVRSMVERGDILHLDLGRCRPGVEVGVRHLGERRVPVGVLAEVGVGAGVRWAGRGVIRGVSAGAGVDLGRPCQRSKILGRLFKRSIRTAVDIDIACR